MASGIMTEQSSEWLLSTQLKNPTQTITLNTAKKYIKKYIKLNITTQAAKTAAGVAVGDTVIYDGTNDTDINPNLIKLNGLQSYYSAIAYNQATNTYTITNPASPNTSCGSGVSIKQDGTIVPYGSNYRVSMEVYVPTQSSYSIDINNNVQSGTVWAGNDNDLISSRTSVSGTIPANQWVTISWGSKNAHASNTSKTGLIVYDALGIKTANMVWYVRNPKMEIGTDITSWVPSINDTSIVNLGSKVTLTSGTGSKYYIPLKTTGSGYTEVSQKGWIEAGNKDKAEVINTNYINIPEATFQNITVTTNTSKVQLVSAEGYTEGKYISALTIPAKKTLDTLTLTAGDSSGRTYLSTLNVNGYTTVSGISLSSGIITTITATGGGYIGTANLNNANSYIGNVYGTGYIRTNSGNTLAKYTQNGTLTTYEGSGGITNYSNTGTITNMTGSRTITNLGTSSTAGTLNITTNTYGTINVWGGKTKDKGVTIANHVVTVDGDGTNAGTAVTNSSGDLIIGTAGAITGGGVSGTLASTNVATSTDNNGIYVTRAAASYSITKAGWIKTGEAGTGLSSNNTYITAINVPKDKPFTVSMSADTEIDDSSTLTIANGAYRQIAVTNQSGGKVSVGGMGTTYFSPYDASHGTLRVVNIYESDGETLDTTERLVVSGGKWNTKSITSASASTVWYGKTVYTKSATWSPSSTYYTTDNTGFGAIPTGNLTPNSAYYIKSGTAISTGGAITGSNVAIGDTDVSGISVFGRARGAITQSGWINAGMQNESTKTQYLAGVTLKTPTSGIRKFAITVPNGASNKQVTFVFTVDANSNVTISSADDGPVIVSQPTNQTAKHNDYGYFTVAAYGNGLAYQWQYQTPSDGNDTWRSCTSVTIGYLSPTVQPISTAGRNGYKYRCKITDANGTVVYSNAATFTTEA